MLRGLGGLVHENQEMAGELVRLRNEVRDLKVLIGEFSRFSRLPKMRPERSDPNALVLDALSPYSQGAPKGVEVTVDLERRVIREALQADVPRQSPSRNLVRKRLLRGTILPEGRDPMMWITCWLLLSVGLKLRKDLTFRPKFERYI